MSGPESVLDAIRARRSVRRYTDEPVAKEVLTKLVESACWAPSAGNRQDWQFDVVTSPGTKREMADAVRTKWASIVGNNRDRGFIEEVERYAKGFGDFENAPAVIAVSARRTDGAQSHMLGDDAFVTVGSGTSAAMAAQNLMLAARALGLGTCCMTGAMAARAELAGILGLDRRQELICLVTVGLPDETPDPPARRPATDVGRFVE